MLYSKKKEKTLGFFFFSSLLCFSLIFVFLNCSRDSSRSSIRDSSRRDRDDRDRDRSLSRSSGGSSLRLIDDSDHFAILRSRDFDGDDCEDVRDCEDLCDEIFNRSDGRNKCDRLPEDMVEALYDTFEALNRIRENSLDRINAAALGTIIDIDEDAIIDLIEDDWGERELIEFLNFLAKSSLSILALESEDPDHTIFEKALKQLSDFTNVNKDEIIGGLSMDIGRYAETFLYVAEQADNEEAVIYVFDFLDSYYPSANEQRFRAKFRILCSREEVDNDRRRGSSVCHQFGDRNRRLSRNKYCYVQGAGVWSYIGNLLEDRDLRDSDLSNVHDESGIDEDYCDDFCDDVAPCDRDDL